MTTEATPGALGSNDELGAPLGCAKCGEALYRYTVTVDGREYHPGCAKPPSLRQQIAELQRRLGECSGALQTVEREAALWEERARHLGWRDEHGA